MIDLAAGDLLDRLAERQVSLALVATGGGTSAISAMCGVPGASRVVVEAIVPYATAAVDRLLGGRQDQYCSDRTARRLATAAWQRSAAMTSPEVAMGAAVTASLVTSRPKRGAHRVHAAVQTVDRTLRVSVELAKDVRDRSAEEHVAAAILFAAIRAVLSGGTAAVTAESCAAPWLLAGERLQVESVNASVGLRALMSGSRRALDAASLRAGAAPHSENRLPGSGLLVFPGSFDPLHDGHLGMASVAERIANAPLVFELSVTNVDKPTLDHLEIHSRVAAFPTSRTLWLTRAATFVEKTDVFSDATFVLGADTFCRLADPRYTNGSMAETILAAERIAGAVRGLIVFGRLRGREWLDPSMADVPECLRRVTRFVPREEFAMDISSTALRASVADG